MPHYATESRAFLSQELWQLAWPAILRNTLNCASDRVTLVLVGHYDDSRDHYDGAGLGKMFSNITGLSVGFGINLGLATLCAQAHGAGRASKENALHLRRCLVLLSVALIYTCTAAALCKPLLDALGQPEGVAASSASYAQVQLIGVPFFWVANALQSVCDGLQQTKPGLYANAASSLFQVVLCVLAIHPAVLNMGYLGMAASRSVGGVLQLAVMIGLIRANKLERLVWRLPSRSAAYGNEAMIEPLHASGAGEEERVHGGGGVLSWRGLCAIVMWLEWWSFEGFSLFVGLLQEPDIALAAHGTMFNILVVTYMFFTGLGTALCASSGKYIGAGRGDLVPALCVIALAFAAVASGVICTSLQLLARPLGHLFTEDEAVVDVIARSMLGAVLSVPGYACLMTLYGACRGANHQRTAALGTAIGYAIGLPLAYVFGVRLGWPHPLLGVWLGNVAALGFAALWVLTIVVTKDWAAVKAISSYDGASGGACASGALPDVVLPAEPVVLAEPLVVDEGFVSDGRVR